MRPTAPFPDLANSCDNQWPVIIIPVRFLKFSFSTVDVPPVFQCGAITLQGIPIVGIVLDWRDGCHQSAGVYKSARDPAHILLCSVSLCYCAL